MVSPVFDVAKVPHFRQEFHRVLEADALVAQSRRAPQEDLTVRT
jgi:hypothetical protein